MNCFFFPLSYSHELLPYSFKTRPRIQDTGDAQRLQVKVQSYELGEEESSILQRNTHTIPKCQENVQSVRLGLPNSREHMRLHRTASGLRRLQPPQRPVQSPLMNGETVSTTANPRKLRQRTTPSCRQTTTMPTRQLPLASRTLQPKPRSHTTNPPSYPQ